MSVLLPRAALVGLLALGLSACHPSAPDEAPTGLAVTPGDGRVTVSWDMRPGFQYWLYAAAAPGVTPDNWLNLPQATAKFPAVSPFVFTGLTNGTEYSFALTAMEGGPQGPAAGPISAVPRLAGASWSSGTPLGAGLNGAIYALSQFVVVGDGGLVVTSSDGTSFTAATSGTTADLHAVTFGNQLLVAVGAGGTTLTSTDAVTWTLNPAIAGAPALRGVAAGLGSFVAVGDGGAVYSSTDGASWTAQSSGVSADLLAVRYLNGTYVAVGTGGTLLTSIDTVLWTAGTSGSTATLRGAAYLSPTYVVAGSAGTVLSSTDLLTWTAQAAGTFEFHGLHGGSQFIAVGDGGAVSLSVDGITWTPAASGSTADLRAAWFAAGTYLAVGAGGANLSSR